jgi:REP element-mobilizing transposase RayT
MSRLRRPFLYDRYIFVTVDLLKLRTGLQEQDYQRLARCLAKMREKHGFLLTAWVFLPDHWHAIIYPPHPLTISTVLKAVKVSSMISQVEEILHELESRRIRRGYQPRPRRRRRTMFLIRVVPKNIWIATGAVRVITSP